jgi:hypothetical protein
MQRGVAGWVAEVLLALVLVSAPVTGVWLAVRSLRRGGAWPAWTALVLNVALVLLTCYLFFDAVRMTYFPG